MNFRRSLLKAAAAAAFSVTLAGSAVQADTKFLKMDGYPASGSAGQITIAFSQAIQKNLDMEIQVSIGKAATKSAIDAASGKVDLISFFPTVNFLMQKKLAMFSKVEKAPEMAAKLRAMFAYPLGPFHIVVYEESGIKSLKDLKGKKVFLGPPAGAATSTMTQVIKAATGLTAGEDFELLRFDWKSAETAFLDKQMDVYAAPTALPSPLLEQFGKVAPIRLLGLSDEQLASEPMKKIFALPGRTVDSIPNGSYADQVNEAPVKTMGNWGGIGTHMGVDADTVYQMTKAYWDNIEDVKKTASWMNALTKEQAFTQINIPLHEGAYRYYKEAGFDVPEALIPPEAK